MPFTYACLCIYCAVLASWLNKLLRCNANNSATITVHTVYSEDCEFLVKNIILHIKVRMWQGRTHSFYFRHRSVLSSYCT
jgi:hypothetical protein